jgi:hypothetical protein
MLQGRNHFFRGSRKLVCGLGRNYAPDENISASKKRKLPLIKKKLDMPLSNFGKKISFKLRIYNISKFHDFTFKFSAFLLDPH